MLVRACGRHIFLCRWLCDGRGIVVFGQSVAVAELLEGRVLAIWALVSLCAAGLVRNPRGYRAAILRSHHCLYARHGPKRGRRFAGSSLRSEEHTSELQSLMRISYAVFCLKKKTKQKT